MSSVRGESTHPKWVDQSKSLWSTLLFYYKKAFAAAREGGDAQTATNTFFLKKDIASSYVVSTLYVINPILSNVITCYKARTPTRLKIKSSSNSVNIYHLSCKIKIIYNSRFHGIRINFFQIYSSLRNNSPIKPH
jgi:hypothetical protein